WRKSSLGGSLENEDSAGHVREALDHRVDRLSSCSVKLEGRDKFPPFSGMCIEQMLHAVETGMVVRGQLRDFVLTHCYHGHHPFMAICTRHGDPFSVGLGVEIMRPCPLFIRHEKKEQKVCQAPRNAPWLALEAAWRLQNQGTYAVSR